MPASGRLARGQDARGDEAGRAEQEREPPDPRSAGRRRGPDRRRGAQGQPAQRALLPARGGAQPRPCSRSCSVILRISASIGSSAGAAATSREEERFDAAVLLRGLQRPVRPHHGGDQRDDDDDPHDGVDEPDHDPDGEPEGDRRHDDDDEDREAFAEHHWITAPAYLGLARRRSSTRSVAWPSSRWQ